MDVAGPADPHGLRTIHAVSLLDESSLSECHGHDQQIYGVCDDEWRSGGCSANHGTGRPIGIDGPACDRH